MKLEILRSKGRGSMRVLWYGDDVMMMMCYGDDDDGMVMMVW